MTDRTDKLPLWGPAWASFRDYLRLEQDPLLADLRGRLFVLRLRVLAPAALGLGALEIYLGASWVWMLPFAWMLLTLAWLRAKGPSPWLAFALGLVFLAAGSHLVLSAPAGQFSAATVILTLLPIYGTFVAGALAGGFFCLAAAAVIARAMVQHQGVPGVAMIASFCFVLAFWYYAAALAQVWVFTSVVRRLRTSHLNTLRADSAVQDLGAILADIAQKGVSTLRKRLELGLPESNDLQPFGEELATTRAWLPKSLPRSSVSGAILVDQLQMRAYQAFLAFTLLAAGAAGLILYRMNSDWPLAAVACAFVSLSLFGHRFLARWQSSWKLLMLVYACVAFWDLWVLRAYPPPASLTFLPLMVYVSSFLGNRRLALVTLCCGLAALAWSIHGMDLQGSLPFVFIGIGVAAIVVLQTGRFSMQEQARLLDRLAVEEAALFQSLSQYRALVSALFHDLANPLSVLQSLAQLPPKLRQEEDLERARRMVDRMEGVLRNLGAQAPRFKPCTVAELHQELWDTHSEALRRKKLQWGLGAGAALGLKKAGAPLRDGILAQLLSNAIRFAPLGSRLELSAEVRNGGIILLLRDHGPGLPKDVSEDLANEHLPRARPDTLGERGLGLGLTLAASRVKTLGGSLSFRSLPGGGLEAAVWLPA